MDVTVIGAGYVGLVTGVSLAMLGDHSVTLVEHSESRRQALEAGKVPIWEPGLQDAFARVRAQVSVVSSVNAIGDPDLVFICVGTPTERGEPDLAQLNVATSELRDRSDLHISVRSTLPPGTSARLPILLGRQDGGRLSTNPEFLRQGAAMDDFANPSRIVFGLFPETSPAHRARVADAFRAIPGTRLEVSVAAAELMKNVANGFLALKLSFVNEVAALAEEYGVQVDEILDGIALDPRIGSAYMRPGLGFGGSCLPKELEVLAAAGRRQGLPMHVARAAAQVNGEQQDRFIKRVLKELPSSEVQVGLLGLSFKAGTDDLRGSPAIYVARRLVEAGHRVVAFDPAVGAVQAREAVPGIEIRESALEVFRGSSAVVIATDWPDFRDVDLGSARHLAKGPLLFDGRNVLVAQSAVNSGFHYRGIGRLSME